MSEMTLDQVRDWHLKRSKDLMKYAVDPMKLRSANLHRKSADVINAEIKRRDALQGEQFLHAIVSITDILDGRDTGVGVCNEPWQSVRMRLIELVKRRASAQGEAVIYQERWLYADVHKNPCAWYEISKEEYEKELANPTRHCEVRVLYAAPPAAAVPDGWKLVPIDPTHEMCGAPSKVWHPEAKSIYKAMLAAAPQPDVKDINYES